MRIQRWSILLFAAAFSSLFTLAGCSGTQSSTPHVASESIYAPCSQAAAGHARCFALERTDVGTSTASFERQTLAIRKISVLPDAFGPTDLQLAYGLPSLTAGAGQTVAIVDAFDDPAAESDMAVYRSRYGLPACTAASGCFAKYAEDGSNHYPTSDRGWAAEISLDLDIVSAICPNCSIKLIEAKSDGFDDLAAGVDEAASFHPASIANSFGAAEFSGEAGYESHWTHPGIVISASTGDDGEGVQFPAASAHVVAVGGTTLSRTVSARGYTESAWSKTGGGCSALAKPAWQTDGGCPNRTVADVAFVASTDSPVAVYQSYCGGPICGWTEYGGTSVGAPAIAAIYALAGNAASQNGAEGLYHAPAGSLRDISTGNDGLCETYLCDAGLGYDGPSGKGSPIGIAAF